MRTRLEAAWYGNRNITNTAVPSIIILISMGCYLFSICYINSRCNRAELIDTSDPSEHWRQTAYIAATCIFMLRGCAIINYNSCVVARAQQHSWDVIVICNHTRHDDASIIRFHCGRMEPGQATGRYPRGHRGPVHKWNRYDKVFRPAAQRHSCQDLPV